MVAPIVRDVELFLPRSGQEPASPAAVPLGSEAYVRCYTGRHATPCYVEADYGPTAAYGTTTPRTPTAGVHQLALGALTPGSTYHFRLRATDPADVANPTTSQDFSFTLTPAALPAAGPALSAITVGTISATSATITWTTASAPNAFIHYATSPEGLDRTPTILNETGTQPRTSHSVVLATLTGTTRYYFRIRQPDAAGNVSLSPVQTFVTI
jgi:Purple acid Phosphatase, N-terminal domain